MYGHVSCWLFCNFEILIGFRGFLFTSFQFVSVVVEGEDSKFHVYDFKVLCSA